MTALATTQGSLPSEQPAPSRGVSSHALGFWIYLMSDAILFALLFATYAAMSRNYAGGPTAKELFDIAHTAGETLLLLMSSLTCGLALLALAESKLRSVLLWLATTLLLGLGFVTMEVTEFQNLIQQGAGPDRSGFLSAFFTLVGTHGLHVSFGMVWILVMMAQLLTKGLTVKVSSRLQRWSLFWHFLDIVWIGIFSVVYLPGVL